MAVEAAGEVVKITEEMITIAKGMTMIADVATIRAFGSMIVEMTATARSSRPTAMIRIMM